jgi:hypothetical protein
LEGFAEPAPDAERQDARSSSRCGAVLRTVPGLPGDRPRRSTVGRETATALLHLAKRFTGSLPSPHRARFEELGSPFLSRLRSKLEDELDLVRAGPGDSCDALLGLENRSGQRGVRGLWLRSNVFRRSGR